MCYAYNEKKTKRETMQEIANQNKHQNIWQKWKLQVLRNIRSGHNQNEMKRTEKSASEVEENISSSSLTAEISSKKQTPWQSSLSDILDHS